MGVWCVFWEMMHSWKSHENHTYMTFLHFLIHYNLFYMWQTFLDIFLLFPWRYPGGHYGWGTFVTCGTWLHVCEPCHLEKTDKGCSLYTWFCSCDADDRHRGVFDFACKF